MTLKQQAILKTIAFIALASIFGISAALVFTYVPVESIITAAIVGVCGYIIYLCYTVVLAQLVWEERFSEREKLIRGDSQE